MSDGNVRPLRVVSAEPDPEMVATVEKLLERVKRGEIVALAVALQVRPADTGTVYSVTEDGDIAHLVLAIERLKLRLLEAR